MPTDGRYFSACEGTARNLGFGSFIGSENYKKVVDDAVSHVEGDIGRPARGEREMIRVKREFVYGFAAFRVGEMHNSLDLSAPQERAEIRKKLLVEMVEMRAPKTTELYLRCLDPSLWKVGELTEDFHYSADLVLAHAVTFMRAQEEGLAKAGVSLGKILIDKEEEH